jgi:Aminoglycoside-2''-adenylyltransferase
MPLSVGEVAELFSGLDVPWWFTGGHALEMHCGRGWRDHDDIDVGISREHAGGLASLPDDWEVQVAAAGTLRPWDGAVPAARRSENNLWLRQGGGPWRLDIAIGEGDADAWIYRRDPSLRVPWDVAVCHSADGTAYLTPALQLLFKSKDVRPKDDVDAAEVIPTLDAWGVALLDVRLRGSHRWRTLLEQYRRACSGADVLEVLEVLSAAGVEAWVDGGWGIDALIGEQSREHADVDLALPTRRWGRALRALESRSFAIVRDDGPYNVVLLDPLGRLVDLHAFDDTTTVTGTDGVARHGPNGLAYEAGGFDGAGTIDGRSVPCMSAGFQMRSHTGYEVDEVDFHDVRLLHQRFGIAIPDDYARWASST